MLRVVVLYVGSDNNKLVVDGVMCVGDVVDKCVWFVFVVGGGVYGVGGVSINDVLCVCLCWFVCLLCLSWCDCVWCWMCV